MNAKSIALAVAISALPVVATAAVVGGGGAPSSDSSNSNVAPGVAGAICVPRSTNTAAEAARLATLPCPKSITIMIGRQRVL